MYKIYILQTKQVVIVIDKYKYIVVIYIRWGMISRERERARERVKNVRRDRKLKPRDTVKYIVLN